MDGIRLEDRQGELGAAGDSPAPPNLDALNESVRSAEELIDSLNEMLASARRQQRPGDAAFLQQPTEPILDPLFVATGDGDTGSSGVRQQQPSEPVSLLTENGSGKVSEPIGSCAPVELCSFCSHTLAGRFVQCGRCSQNFHAEKLCLGVEEGVIES